VRLSIWMCPWDLEGREPEAVLDELESLGLNACSLALAYHGGRMVLPRHPWRLVYEQHPSAIYFAADLSRFGRLRPAISPLVGVVPPFLEAAARRRFPVEAWTVFCHNDYLGALAPDCCIENLFGDHYTYALCPSHPDVRDYILSLCAAVASVPGISGIDVEALSYMSYEHSSLHDKRGAPLAPPIARLLSICFCRHCRERFGVTADDGLRRAVRAALNGELFNQDLPLPAVPCPPPLTELRSVSAGLRLNLRMTPDPTFHGGKTALAFADAARMAHEATVTFFGGPIRLDHIPPRKERPLSLRAGFVFHGPDCAAEADFRRRFEVLAGADLDGISFYSYSMASREHLKWLRRALKGVLR